MFVNSSSQLKQIDSLGCRFIVDSDVANGSREANSAAGGLGGFSAISIEFLQSSMLGRFSDAILDILLKLGWGHSRVAGCMWLSVSRLETTLEASSEVRRGSRSTGVVEAADSDKSLKISNQKIVQRYFIKSNLPKYKLNYWELL
ncbi:hypothetical protein BB561_005059 [Smittium simulii]|uniref:Uncharacterized protein n=1 Tax=Smittium simulii TaxID=133385 RepID=A0A2T9YCH6_9FUNG|nr:hypothetical protein BB561_005059 [Smittium simulii]